jgi:replication factor C subunit 3/5
MTTYSSHDSKSSSTLPWIEKFRPKTLDDIVSNESVIDSFKQYVSKKYLPHLLLHGSSGTGKTSTIYACARELYGENYDIMVLEINASEERGIEVIRGKVKNFVMNKNLFFYKIDMFKLVILDEADAMTGDAQSMLRRLIEDYTGNARFCLICNKIKSIDPAIQSRCTNYKFSPLSDKDIRKRINFVAKEKNVDVTTDGIDTIIKIAKGDMRRVLNILQTTSMAYSVVNSDNVISCTGHPKPDHIMQIYKSLTTEKFVVALDFATKIKNDYGYSLLELITELHAMLINIFLKDESLPAKRVMSIVKKLKNIELNLMSCPGDNIQMAAIIGAFYL